MPPVKHSIGAMRHVLTVQVVTTTVDALGGRDPEWSDSFHVYGQVEPLSGVERLQAGQVTAAQPYRVTTRYRSDLGVRNRIVWGSHTLEVLSAVNENARNQWLILDCAEVTT